MTMLRTAAVPMRTIASDKVVTDRSGAQYAALASWTTRVARIGSFATTCDRRPIVTSASAATAMASCASAGSIGTDESTAVRQAPERIHSDQGARGVAGVAGAVTSVP